MMNHLTSESKIYSMWEKEYKKKGIPSSYRKEASQVVLDFMHFCQGKGVSPGNAVDIGCGRGRNSFYLASLGYSVIAMDLLQSNIDIVNDESKHKKLPILAYAQDVSQRNWPIQENSQDIVMDIFCYKHVPSKKKQRIYREQLWKVMRGSAYYFISLASINDGFYGPLLSFSKDLKQNYIIDPYSNIPSFLYSIEELILEFSDLFRIIEAKEKHSTSPMYGTVYSRAVINAIFQKKS